MIPKRDVSDAVVLIGFRVSARFRKVGTAGGVGPGRRRRWNIAFAPGCGEKPIDRIVNKVAIESVGAEHRVLDSAARGSVGDGEDGAHQIVEVTKLLQGRSGSGGV